MLRRLSLKLTSHHYNRVTSPPSTHLSLTSCSHMTEDTYTYMKLVSPDAVIPRCSYPQSSANSIDVGILCSLWSPSGQYQQLGISLLQIVAKKSKMELTVRLAKRAQRAKVYRFSEQSLTCTIIF